MSGNEFEKTSIGWQLMQWQQQFGEWIELKFSQNKPNLPDLGFSDRLLEVLWPFLRAASWLLLGLVIIWVLWQLWLVLNPYIYSLKFELGNPASKTAAESETARDWWRRSQQFYQQGNYREATRCLYLAMLQKLHDSNVIPQQASRTDEEYRQLTQPLAKQESYQLLLNTHENICFGNADISPEVFQQCQQAYREIEKPK